MQSQSRVNALSIDVEEHFHVHAFSKWIQPKDWDLYTSRVVGNTQKILSLLRKYDVQATFFVLGWVAERYPDLIKEIVADGHEIGSHSYHHQLVYTHTHTEFADDLEQSLEAITRAAPATSIVGYRAPSFSITDKTMWVQEILLSYGFQYDSSIFPVAFHDRYGIRGAQRFAHRMESGLWEFPMSTIRFAKQNLPVAGGGYFRLYPLWLTQRAIRSINEEGQPAILYLHPWEVDPDQPRIKEAAWNARFRHYVNIDKVIDRLKRLLETHDFAPLAQVFADELALFELDSANTRRHLQWDQDCYAHHYRNPGGALLSSSGAGHALP